MVVKFGNGTKDVPLTEVTRENYIVPKGEESTYHVIQELKRFDQRTGKRKSRPQLQKYDAKVWNTQMRHYLASTGYDVIVLHDPSEYNRQQQAIKAQTIRERKEAAAKAEAERKKAEREALKAELRAELRAEMKAEAKAEKTKKSNK